MRKLLTFSLVVFAMLFSGCATTRKEVNILQFKPLKIQNNEKTKIIVSLYSNEMVTLHPFQVENAVYHLAKYAKEQGYNYVFITYPKAIKNYMPGSVKDLDECLNSSWAFGKCPYVRNYKAKSPRLYILSAIAYKKQPFDVVTLPVDDLLDKYKKYDLQKYNYKIKIERK